jgi:hypothetical protein
LRISFCLSKTESGFLDRLQTLFTLAESGPIVLHSQDSFRAPTRSSIQVWAVSGSFIRLTQQPELISYHKVSK